ncbi:uncharacterized protein LOC105700837 [Orussus abietinus]|uniref:uncharacterized protein LOC105700837 n=1 Tax=Orussus abietinus TaxID=222816 RepID=UPI0006257CE7|nr:uncharacterized protein LOC105700837 [Orussus abietinus]XP_012282460.1 uncharacterized protein LOC105700837 [Orussus abietinus]XP_012282461.1 uncharacterized protein LOC105700837 [Orussus abietinus]XP_012282462.1 uncharacterized protein LOC105700837 [Orussus abietinus]
MEVQLPYLQAIQALPGSTPADKFKALRGIAKGITETVPSPGDSVQVTPSAELPESLVPYVRLEIGKILKSCDEVAAALRSEIEIVVNQALQVEWFFDGSHREYTNFQYFSQHLLPYVSLSIRCRLIKCLAIHLSKEQRQVAEEFFSGFARMYGTQETLPLLVSCSENFVRQKIVEYRIVLSCKILENLFRIFPDLAIWYLKLCKPRERNDTVRDLHNIKMTDYVKFLPRLVRDHLDVFKELVELHKPGVQLGRKTGKMFLRKSLQDLIDKPKIYLTIVPMKLIAATLERGQLITMLRNLYPKDLKDFDLDRMLGYLNEFVKTDKSEILLETFKEVYGDDLLNHGNLVTSELLLLLPTEERVRQARLKVKDQNWSHCTSKLAWICYLPTAESIPVLKEQVAKAQDSEDRGSLLRHMVYSCTVNHDEEALLEFLQYFLSRHRNEDARVKYLVLEAFLSWVDFDHLRKDHWSLLENIVELLHVKNELQFRATIGVNILAQLAFHKFQQNQPADVPLDRIIEMNKTIWYSRWNMLEKHPECEKKCLEYFLKNLEKALPENDKVLALNLVTSLMEGIYEFNNRVRATKRAEKLTMTVRNTPWLVDLVKATLNNAYKQAYEEHAYERQRIEITLQKNEKDLLSTWLESYGLDITSGQAYRTLLRDPQKILKNWQKVLDQGKNMAFQKATLKFFRATRWHQEIPIKFAHECMKNVAEKKNESMLVILATLVHGSTLTSILEPLVPSEERIDPSGDKAKEKYQMIFSVPKAIEVADPPVPLELVSSFCQGDYLQYVLSTLTKVARRISISKVLAFAKTLTERRVSVKKHGIRLVIQVASLDEVATFLVESWATETHPSIRAIVFEKSRQLFLEKPGETTWTLMQRCIEGLTEKDSELTASLTDLAQVPNEYITEYIVRVLDAINRSTSKDPNYIPTVISRLIANIDPSIAAFLPEKMCEMLLTKYLFPKNYNPAIATSATIFSVATYLVPSLEKLDQRLAFFAKLLNEVIGKRWDVPDPRCPKFCPVNNTVRKVVEVLSKHIRKDKVPAKVVQRLAESLAPVLPPLKDPFTYLTLSFGAEILNSTSPEEFGHKVGSLVPRYVEVLGQELILFTGHLLRDFLSVNYFTKIKDEEVMLLVIEGLVKTGDAHACIMAATLILPYWSKDLNERYLKVIRNLANNPHPAVRGLVNHDRNKFEFSYPSD